MEGLKKRAFLLAAVFVGFGVWMLLTPRAHAASQVNESWMAQKAPMAVDKFRSVSGPDGSAYTYKMDEITYKELVPLGILAREYSDGSNEFDVVLIASNRKESFHDPRVCFTAQGWDIQYEERRFVETQRGKVPVTVASMVNKSGLTRIAAFFYRGPEGFHGTPQELSWSLLKRVFLGAPDFEGVFYRFMPLHDKASEEELLAFIASYLNESAKTSGGYF